MKKLQLLLANIALWLACAPGAMLYLVALALPRLSQRIVLRNILKSTGVSQAEFKKLPVTTYEDYRDKIEKFHLTGVGDLTSDPTLYLAPTSGSLGVRKLVPYTKGLKSAFRKGIDPWIFFLYLHYPVLFLKRQFWLVTLSDQKDDVGGAIRIGFDEDEEYLGSFQQWLLKKVWIQIPQQSDESLENYLVRVADELSSERELGLVSVWSPSLILGAVNSLMRRRSIWKGVMSCWVDSFATEEAKKLQGLFPHVSIQPKGLISTEAFCTVPLSKRLHLLSYNSHYFEFRETLHSNLCVASELEVGKVYELIVTTQSGFVRYSTGDRVRVNSIFLGHPNIRFVGRDRTSDLRGEKLHEEFVNEVFVNTFANLGIEPEFWFVAPRLDETPCYVLYVAASLAAADVEALASSAEQELQKAYHYNLCQSYGQLLPLKVVAIRSDDPDMVFVQQVAKLTGAKPGSIKVTRLSTFSGWDEVFPSQTE